jgi:hypothetical protein
MSLGVCSCIVSFPCDTRLRHLVSTNTSDARLGRHAKRNQRAGRLWRGFHFPGERWQRRAGRQRSRFLELHTTAYTNGKRSRTSGFLRANQPQHPRDCQPCAQRGPDPRFTPPLKSRARASEIENHRENSETRSTPAHSRAGPAIRQKVANGALSPGRKRSPQGCAGHYMRYPVRTGGNL